MWSIISIEYNLAVEALIGSYYIIPYKCFVDSKQFIKPLKVAAGFLILLVAISACILKVITFQGVVKVVHQLNNYCSYLENAISL